MDPSGNLLLDVLPPALKSELLDAAQHVELPNETQLEECHRPPPYAYFITSGMASVVTEMKEGGSMEVTLISCEGMTGGLSLLGSMAPVTDTFMQVPGSGFKVPMEIVADLFNSSEFFRWRVLQHIQFQALTTHQLAACTALHDVLPRLARWLLMVNDRTGGTAASITHEFLATMLGVHRPTVSVSLNTLQRAGLLVCKRGHIKITDRNELVKAACECYPVTQKLLKALFSN